MTCRWCGDTHRSDQLCQRAERGMTRRSFCFLFGAGIAAALLPAQQLTLEVEWPFFSKDGSVRFQLFSIDMPGGHLPDVDTLLDLVRHLEPTHPPIIVTGWPYRGA